MLALALVFMRSSSTCCYMRSTCYMRSSTCFALKRCPCPCLNALVDVLALARAFAKLPVIVTCFGLKRCPCPCLIALVDVLVLISSRLASCHSTGVAGGSARHVCVLLLREPHDHRLIL